MSPRRLRILLLALLSAAALSACGSQEIELRAADQNNPRLQAGAEIFNDKCATCHTLDSAGAQGSAYNVNDRERVDGPNFNTRNEEVDSVLYAIRNGGFSGAIMPENIVTGEDARKVAEFLAAYSGGEAVIPRTPNTGELVTGG